MIPHHFILEYILDYIEKTSHISDSFFILHTKSIRLEMLLRQISVLVYVYSSFSILLKFTYFLCVLRRIRDKKKKERFPSPVKVKITYHTDSVFLAENYKSS